MIVPSLGGQGTDAAGAALRKAGFVPVVGPTVDTPTRPAPWPT